MADAEAQVASTTQLLGNLALTPSPFPIQSLPIDVVYCIFLACVPDAPRKFATTASHVCRSWRSLALGAAVLWTDLVFDRNRWTVEKNTAWVARSGQAFLDMEIRNDAFEKASIKTARNIVRLIKAQSHRVRILNMGDDMPLKVYRLLFDELRYVRAPELLEIRVENNNWYQSQRWMPRLFEPGAPKLERLALKFTLFDWSSPLLHKLRALRFNRARNFSPTDATDILTRAPRLQSVIFQMWDDLEPEWNEIVPVSTSNKPTLVAHDSLVSFLSAERVFYRLAHQFRFPSMKYLELSNPYMWDPSLGPAPPFNDILPQLEHLTIAVRCNGDNFHVESKLTDMLSGFATMKTITTIEFLDMYFRNPGGEHDLLGGFGRLLPPNVHTILLEACVIGDKLASLKAFVASRKDVEGIAPIRKLSLKVEWEPSLEAYQEDEDLKWLEENVKDLHLGLFVDHPDVRPYWGYHDV